MADYCEKETISQTLKNKLYDEASRSTGERREFCFEIIDKLKSWCDEIITADVRENVHGSLVLVKKNFQCQLYRCSLCGALTAKMYNFCPNCGADMRGDENAKP